MKERTSFRKRVKFSRRIQRSGLSSPMPNEHPVHMASHLVQRHLAGEQETYWDKQTKKITILDDVTLFLSCSSVFLAHRQGVLYRVTDQLQRAYSHHLSAL